MDDLGSPQALRIVHDPGHAEVIELIAIPRKIWFGEASHPSQIQWHLEIWDLEKDQARSLPLASITRFEALPSTS